MGISQSILRKSVALRCSDQLIKGVSTLDPFKERDKRFCHDDKIGAIRKRSGKKSPCNKVGADKTEKGVVKVSKM